MPYKVILRRNGSKVGQLGPFSTQRDAIAQGQLMADQAADDVVVTVETIATNPRKSGARRKARRRTRRAAGRSTMRGSSGVPALKHPGKLTDKGYRIDKTQRARRQALGKVVKAYGVSSTRSSLQWLLNFARLSTAQKKRVENDKAWLQKTHG